MASAFVIVICCLFFFNDTATTEIYTLSLHDALPIYGGDTGMLALGPGRKNARFTCTDRKSTRLNSSHLVISYAVFCLKQKKDTTGIITHAVISIDERQYGDTQHPC